MESKFMKDPQDGVMKEWVIDVPVERYDKLLKFERIMGINGFTIEDDKIVHIEDNSKVIPWIICLGLSVITNFCLVGVLICYLIKGE